MRRRRWGCLLVLVVLVVGVGVLLSGVLRPEHAPEDLRRRTRRVVSVDPAVYFTVGGTVVDAGGNGVADVAVEISNGDQRWTATTRASGQFLATGVSGIVTVTPALSTVPASQTLFRPRTDLRFVHAEACAFYVEVFDTKGGTAGLDGSVEGLPAAVVALRFPSGELLEQRVDAEAKAAWERVPCGPATVEVRAEGYLTATLPVETAEGWTWAHLQSARSGAVRVFGRVRDGLGPVHGAELGALPHEGGSSGESGPDGRYSVTVPGPGPYVLFAEHAEHQVELDSILVPPGVSEWEHDVELEPIRKVKVYCAGLPEDGCHDLPLVMCTEPWAPASYPCVEESGVITCRCPLGEAAVRGGGESVLIGPDEDEAWLDLRAPGGITGTVLVDGEPSSCTLEVVRWSLELAGGGGLRTHACLPDGTFFVPSLQEGSWRVVVRAEGLESALGPVEVRDEVVDVGTVDLTGGVMLAGLVVWEDDESPVPGVSVAAVEVDALAGGEAPPVGTAVTDEQGSFAIFGLEPGRYEVLLPRDPGSAQVVELDEADVFVELVREGGSGLSLGRDDEDRLVVLQGDDGGWLESGDRITRVEVAGIDLLGALPRYGDAVGESILGMVGWPGLVVEVERAGERRTIREE